MSPEAVRIAVGVCSFMVVCYLVVTSLRLKKRADECLRIAEESLERAQESHARAQKSLAQALHSYEQTVDALRSFENAWARRDSAKQRRDAETTAVEPSDTPTATEWRILEHWPDNMGLTSDGVIVIPGMKVWGGNNQYEVKVRDGTVCGVREYRRGDVTVEESVHIETLEYRPGAPRVNTPSTVEGG